jgi:hypothetical protein
MSKLTTPISPIEVRQLRHDLKKYEELLDTYRAITVANREEKTGKLKKLQSLTSLM